MNGDFFFCLKKLSGYGCDKTSIQQNILSISHVIRLLIVTNICVFIRTHKFCNPPENVFPFDVSFYKLNLHRLKVLNFFHHNAVYLVSLGVVCFIQKDQNVVCDACLAMYRYTCNVLKSQNHIVTLSLSLATYPESYHVGSDFSATPTPSFSTIWYQNSSVYLVPY